MPESCDLQSALVENFGFGEFRALQEDAVRAAVEGRDLLVVMPTGAGKSLCFQLPAALQAGVTLVVSPLIALMRDQVEALQRRTAFGRLGCACLNSLQSSDEQREVLAQMRAGRLRLLYIAPERFRSSAFLEALRGVPIARFVVDEAHCISEWGHDFRPDYLALKDVVEALGRPPLTAVTATATRRVQQSIIDNLGMRDPAAFIGGFNRPNLHYAVLRCASEREREERLARALPKLTAPGGSGLIYAATRKQCEEIAALASQALAPVGKRAGAYHAGLEPELRNEMQSRWLAGDIHVLVATNAFGMGIDKPDVRFVVHCACPESIESYYQEAGRAGRDGRKSRCVVLYHFTDRRTREWFIDNDSLTIDAVQTAHAALCAQAVGDVARLSKSEWGRDLGWSEVRTRLALGELERAGLIQRVGETSDDLLFQISHRRFPPDALRRIQADLGRQRRERYRRLDEIVAYCKTTECRRRTVLDYFGDLEESPGAGFCCDNCDRPAQAGAALPASRPAAGRVPMPPQIAPGDIHALLEGLDALRPSLGKARLNQLLRASASKDVQKFRDDGCPLYGALRGASREQVEALLSRLIADGLLHQGDEDAYFVCAVTDAGRAAWQERRALDIPLPGSPPPKSAVEDSAAGPLFEALRAWRRTQAGVESLPPYCIFGDRTLLEIARHRPTDRTALRAVNGVGDAKLDKYGAAVLDITCQYA